MELEEELGIELQRTAHHLPRLVEKGKVTIFHFVDDFALNGCRKNMGVDRQLDFRKPRGNEEKYNKEEIHELD